MRPSLLSQTPEELSEIMEGLGEPSYRGGQILEWLWQKRATSIEGMSNLPARLREHLKESFTLRSLSPAKSQGSRDSTRKFLFRLHDGRYIECVLIPASPALYGERSDRRTLCVSSQVGCAFGCKFCASGLDGFTRNLTADEIAGQVLLAEELSGEKVNNIVFMGMGEPLANLPQLLKALELITSPWGLGIGARHLTVSTSGLVPQIRKLADHPQQIRLAISLHGASNDVRDHRGLHHYAGLHLSAAVSTTGKSKRAMKTYSAVSDSTSPARMNSSLSLMTSATIRRRAVMYALKCSLSSLPGCDPC